MSRRLEAALALAVAALSLALPGTAETPVDAKAARRESAIAGKPLAPIGLDYALDAPPRVGLPVEVTVTVTTQAALANGVLTLRAPDRLAATSLTVAAPGIPGRSIPLAGAAGPGASVPLPDLGPSEALVVTVVLVPLTAELSHLTVVVGGDIGPARQTRGLVIGFRLGPRRPPDAPLTRDDSGQLIRSLPAR